MDTPASCRSVTYICDLGVGAFALGAGQLQPLAVLGRAVLLQRALVLSLTPATLEVRVGFQAQATAVTHGPTLVQVNCGDRKRERTSEMQTRWVSGGMSGGVARREGGRRSGVLVPEAVWDFCRGINNGG